MMRLRALRLEVDAKLALGQFSLEEAADCLTCPLSLLRWEHLGCETSWTRWSGSPSPWRGGVRDDPADGE